jgi:ATP-dependent Clp protease ATP-binding subunit ClpA
MKSRHSSSLILIWRVAEAEARQLSAQEIEPIHLLIGLCKVVDLDLTALVSNETPDRDAILEELLREVRRVRTVLYTAQVDARALRRKLRGPPMDERFSMAESESLHRSTSARMVFADAEHFAQLAESIVYPAHLLYAVLQHEDAKCHEIFQELGVDKARFQEVAKREVIFQQDDASTVVTRKKTHWN